MSQTIVVYLPTGSTAYEREMTSTPPMLLRSIALLYLSFICCTHTQSIKYSMHTLMALANGEITAPSLITRVQQVLSAKKQH